MNQLERREWLIQYLLEEYDNIQDVILPKEAIEQRKLLRALMNVREPKEIASTFLKIQDDYLKIEIKLKKITTLKELIPIQKGIYLWRGDITTLKVDGIVNAANNALLGCFIPNHGCIDNAIHSGAGIQLRIHCQQIMEQQNHSEATGEAKITPAYNLPSQHILHTVGPIIDTTVSNQDCEALASCYRSCIQLAIEKGLQSLAFCCISTGEFHFPNELAANIAVKTIQKLVKESGYKIEVLFNVYKEEDYEIYKRLLKTN